ncbi:MAG: hypothetical protein JW798_11585 [Prolixibacteraceae bacterium]|nr:hypothetical protein [Prolixibacteraceae bacterium]
MIKPLIIGEKDDVRRYSGILDSIKLFGKPESLINPEKIAWNSIIGEKAFDAYLIVSPLAEPFYFFSDLIKQKENIYFADQPNFSGKELEKIEEFQNEANTILQPEVTELFHPLTEDFISSNNNHLFFRYTKSVPSKKHIRPAILSALSFLSLLSPMPVKKMDVSTIESSKYVRPHIKIRLKMFDSSISYIIIRVDPDAEHHIIIESNDGNFTFNFSESYVENIHGIRFPCNPVSTLDLLKKSLESFAINISLNIKPNFSFAHYALSFNVLSKLEGLLINGF